MLELVLIGPVLNTDPNRSVFSMIVDEQEFEGFYCGNGEYRVRFMPKATGTYSYSIKSDMKELNGQSCAFTCVEETE